MMYMEQYFMIFIGILVACLIVSIVVHKPIVHKDRTPVTPLIGYKCMKDALGPGKGYCINVTDSPNEKKGVFKDFNECAKNCGVVLDTNVSYVCGKGGKGGKEVQCVQTQQPVDPLAGFYKNESECLSFCKAGQFVK